MTLRRNIETFRLQPQGRLDLEGGRWLEDQIREIPSRYKLWIIDMSQVDFVDSSGLVALIKGLNASTKMGARLAICGLRPPARLILDITKLDHVFLIFDTYEAAISAFCPPEPAKVIELVREVA